MMIVAATRRKFFALAGATPLAAKASIDAEVGKLAGVDVSGVVNLGHAVDGPAPPISSGRSYLQDLTGALNYVKIFGVPDFIEEEARQRSHVTSLDVDIANKRSWSLAVKVQTQRQRNYEQQMSRLERTVADRAKRDAVKKFLGFDWPWY